MKTVDGKNKISKISKDLRKDQLQKQPPEVFYKRRCSQKFRKIHNKRPVPESLF